MRVCVLLSGEQTAIPEKIELNGFTYYRIRDATLLSPGIHNHYYYSADVIERAYQMTDWNDKRVRALYVDHEDDKVPAWVGFVENVYFDGENLKGDLLIADDALAKKIALGARFGISPKLDGVAKNGEMQEFVFENFSIVVNPACKTTFLNSEQEGDDKMEENKMEEQKVEEVKEEPKQEEQETPQEQQPEQPEQEEQKELSEEEMLNTDEFMELKNKYIEFVKKYIKEHPGATIKDAAKAWREKYPSAYKDEDEELKKKKEKYPIGKSYQSKPRNKNIEQLECIECKATQNTCDFSNVQNALWGQEVSNGSCEKLYRKCTTSYCFCLI